MPALLNNWTLGGAAGGMVNYLQRQEDFSREDEQRQQTHDWQVADMQQRENAAANLAKYNQQLDDESFVNRERYKTQQDQQFVMKNAQELRAMEMVVPGLKAMHDQNPMIREAYVGGGPKAAMAAGLKQRQQAQALANQKELAQYKAGLGQQKNQQQGQYVQEAAQRYPNDPRMQEAARGFQSGVTTPAQAGGAAMRAAAPAGTGALPIEKVQASNTINLHQLDPTLPDNFRSFARDAKTSIAETAAVAAPPQEIAKAIAVLARDPNEAILDPALPNKQKDAALVLAAMNRLPDQTTNGGWLWRRYQTLVRGGVDAGQLGEYQQKFLLRQVGGGMQSITAEIQAMSQSGSMTDPRTTTAALIRRKAEELQMSTQEFIAASQAAMVLMQQGQQQQQQPQE